MLIPLRQFNPDLGLSLVLILMVYCLIGHKELSRIEADERDVVKLMKTITEMTNPSTSTHPMLFNIATGNFLCLSGHCTTEATFSHKNKLATKCLSKVHIYLLNQ